MAKKKKHRGHYCWVCGRIRPNEKFCGKGHRQHICRNCGSKPQEYIQRISDERFLWSVWEQKIITETNIKQLEVIARRYGDDYFLKASAIARVARIHPRRKKRCGYLYHNHRELFEILVSTGVIDDWITPLIGEEVCREMFTDNIDGCSDLDDSASNGYEDSPFYDTGWSNEDIPF